MGLLDNFFKPKGRDGLKKGVEQRVKTFPGESRPAASEEPAPQKSSAFLSPKSYVPRSSAQVVPPSRTPPAGDRRPAAPVPAPEAPGARVIVLTLGDVLARIPTQFLQQGVHDPKRELRFEMEDLSADIARGRAAVYLAHIVAQCPDIFVREIEGFDDLQIRLPLQKLVEQIGALPALRNPSLEKGAQRTEPFSPAQEHFGPDRNEQIAPVEAAKPASSEAPPPAPAVPESVVAEAPETSSAVGEEKIQLSLAAILRNCPPTIVVDKLPFVAEGARIALPFPPIEKQLASGKVTVSSLRFVGALPPVLLPFFQAKEGVEVSLSLEEIFQNLPGNQPHPVAEPEAGPIVFSEPPPLRVVAPSVTIQEVDFKPLDPLRVEVSATPPPPVELKPVVVPIFEDRTAEPPPDADPQPESEQITIDLPEAVPFSPAAPPVTVSDAPPEVNSTAAAEPVAKDFPPNPVPIVVSDAPEGDAHKLPEFSSDTPSVVTPEVQPAEIPPEPFAPSAQPGPLRAVLPFLRPPILLAPAPETSEPVLSTPDAKVDEPAAAATPPPGFQPPPEARVESSRASSDEREPVTPPALVLHESSDFEAREEEVETKPVFPGLIPRQALVQVRPLVAAPPSIFAPTSQIHPEVDGPSDFAITIDVPESASPFPVYSEPSAIEALSIPSPVPFETPPVPASEQEQHIDQLEKPTVPVWLAPEEDRSSNFVEKVTPKESQVKVVDDNQSAPTSDSETSREMARVSRVLAELPGIGASILITPTETVHSGELPEGTAAPLLHQAMLALAAALTPNVAGFGVGEVQHVTVHGAQHSISLFVHGKASVGAIHRARIFLPGVRERFVLAAEELALNSQESA